MEAQKPIEPRLAAIFATETWRGYGRLTENLARRQSIYEDMRKAGVPGMLRNQSSEGEKRKSGRTS